MDFAEEQEVFADDRACAVVTAAADLVRFGREGQLAAEGAVRQGQDPVGLAVVDIAPRACLADGQEYTVSFFFQAGQNVFDDRVVPAVFFFVGCHHSDRFLSVVHQDVCCRCRTCPVWLIGVCKRRFCIV